MGQIRIKILSLYTLSNPSLVEARKRIGRELEDVSNVHMGTNAVAVFKNSNLCGSEAAWTDDC